MKFKEISKFPSVNKDLAIVVDKDLQAQEIQKQIKKFGGSTLTEIKPFDIYTGKGIDENKKSIAFNLVFSDNTKTLNDEEINSILNKIIDGLQKTLNAEIRS